MDKQFLGFRQDQILKGYNNYLSATKKQLMKLSFLSLFFAFFICNSGITQNKKVVDSLIDKLKFSSVKEKKIIYADLFDLLVDKDHALSKSYLDSLSKYVGYDKLKLDSAYLNRNYARYYNKIAESKTALEYILKSTKQFESLNLKEEVAFNYNNQGLLEINLGNLENATKYLIKSLELKDSLGYSEFDKLTTYSKLGRVYGHLNNYKRSNEYYRIQEKILNEKGDKKMLSSVWNNLAVNYKKMDSLEVSLTYYKKALEVYEAYNNHWKLALTYGNLASLYVQFDSINLVIQNFNKALNSAKISNNTLEYARILNNMGAFYFDQKDYEKSIQFTEEAININSNSGRKLNLVYNYKNLRKAYAGLNNFKKAYEYLSIEKEYNDSILNKESFDKISELEIKYQTEKKEAQIALQNEEIKTLNAQAENDKLTKTLYSVGMFSFIAIAGLFYFGFKQRIKKNEIAREKQEAIYKQEIEFKKKELASQTLHLVQKNTFIQELKENLEKIKKSPELFKIEFRRLVMLLKKESAEDKDWKVFKSYFSEVHNNFDNKLKSIYADISEKEIRLASFLRMNLSTKEIASMLNVLPESILKSKYRLKKKLGLGKDTDLTSFLNSL